MQNATLSAIHGPSDSDMEDFLRCFDDRPSFTLVPPIMSLTMTHSEINYARSVGMLIVIIEKDPAMCRRFRLMSL